MASKRRKALSATRRGGRVESGGDATLSKALGAALEAPARHPEIARSLTHGFHSYPARLDPATARSLIAELAPTALLDPFCGSGTTLIEAAAAGVAARGIDANPLAVRLARTRTWRAGGGRRRALRRAARDIAAAAIERGKQARRAGAQRKPTPPARRALSRWFSPHVFAELETLLELIRGGDDPELVPHLEMVLSSVIHKVSLRSSDTDRSRVERRVPRGAAARRFAERADELVEGLADLARSRARDAAGDAALEIAWGDARELAEEPGRFDLVLTSPPYAGTYDYAEQHDLRLAFLGIDGAELRARELGARRHFRRDPARALRRWKGDMGKVLAGCAAALAPGGRLCLVAGDSLAGGEALRADTELTPLAAEAGLELVAWANQARPPLGGREKRAFTRPPKREHLLLYTRADRLARGGARK